MQLIRFGPAGYPAYARLRYIPDPSRPGQAEADARVPADRPADISQARRAMRRLASFTSTPEECYFCLWEGYSDIELPRHVSLVELPDRRYALLQGSVQDVDSWEELLGARGHVPPPALVWPADRSWCIASDVDPHWAGIGGAQAAVEALVDDPELDVVPARPTKTQPAYR